MSKKSLGILIYTCHRCNYFWTPRSSVKDTYPERCPQCKSRKWNANEIFFVTEIKTKKKFRMQFWELKKIIRHVRATMV